MCGVGRLLARPRIGAQFIVRRGFFRPAECAGKLPHAASCGILVALEQATQHISEFGWEGLVAGRGVEARVTLWDAWRLESERNFGMGSAIWGGASTLGRDSYLVEERLNG